LDWRSDWRAVGSTTQRLLAVFCPVRAFIKTNSPFLYHKTKITNHDQINLIPVDFIFQLFLQAGHFLGKICISFPVFGLIKFTRIIYGFFSKK
jgi:hypothetical protein